MQAKHAQHVESGNSIRKVPTSSLVLPIVLVTIVVAVAAIAGILPRSQQRESWGAEAKELSVPTVTVVSPKSGAVGDRLHHPAEIKPLNEAVIYARANGYLKRLVVDLGDRVKAGQLLAEIDTPELDHELERAKALLEQAQAAVGLAKATSERWTDLSKTASVSDQETAEKQADWSGPVGDGTFLLDLPGPTTWPIVGASYILIYNEQSDAAKAKSLLGFLDWCLGKGDGVAEELGYVPLPDGAAQRNRAAWAAKVKSGGKAVWSPAAAAAGHP